MLQILMNVPKDLTTVTLFLPGVKTLSDLMNANVKRDMKKELFMNVQVSLLFLVFSVVFFFILKHLKL